jgi:hypothetical protein
MAIFNVLGKSLARTMDKHETAKALWDALTSRFDNHSASRKVMHARRFTMAVMLETDDMETHLSKMDNLYENVVACSDIYPETTLVNFYLKSVENIPHFCKFTSTLVNVVPAGTLTLNFIKEQLTAEYEKMKEHNLNNSFSKRDNVAFGARTVPGKILLSFFFIEQNRRFCPSCPIQQRFHFFLFLFAVDFNRGKIRDERGNKKTR